MYNSPFLQLWVVRGFREDSVIVLGQILLMTTCAFFLELRKELDRLLCQKFAGYAAAELQALRVRETGVTPTVCKDFGDLRCLSGHVELPGW